MNERVDISSKHTFVLILFKIKHLLTSTLHYTLISIFLKYQQNQVLHIIFNAYAYI